MACARAGGSQTAASANLEGTAATRQTVRDAFLRDVLLRDSTAFCPPDSAPRAKLLSTLLTELRAHAAHIFLEKRSTRVLFSAAAAAASRLASTLASRAPQTSSSSRSACTTRSAATTTSSLPWRRGSLSCATSRRSGSLSCRRSCCGRPRLARDLHRLHQLHPHRRWTRLPHLHHQRTHTANPGAMSGRARRGIWSVAEHATSA